MFCFGHNPLLQLAALYQSNHHKMPAVQISYHLLPTARLAKKKKSGRPMSYQITRRNQHLFPPPSLLTREHLCIGLNETIPEVIKR